MTEEYVRKKIGLALDNCELFISKIESGSHDSWSRYFYDIKANLMANDIEGAVRARDAIPFPNMGGFIEFLEHNPELDPIYSSLSKNIGDLKVYARYGIVREDGES